ncbi:VOC family protein [Ktedonosporobacter rubrisoli]|uniref:VOC family protein n=1 Tax=Ktedonosporobacter rubrisoli TaxID=2509675 RepID=A0A4V0YYP5_KTERU|nr:VOC family protein [Ktedonosporobacter rubrisoli]QBD76941.1 VOC family protein [Ktedonosporobacter rubrisoli]
MQLNANGLSHLGLRVTNLARTKQFYVQTLGCQLLRETDGGILVNVAGILVTFYEIDADSAIYDRFNPFRVGLDHLALAVETPGLLADLKRDFDKAGVRNNGIEEDPETHDQYISFYDPDGIAWELYALSTPYEK